MADKAEALPDWMQGQAEPVAGQGAVTGMPDWMQGQAEAAPQAAGPAQYTGWDRGLRLGGQALVQGATGIVGLPGNLEALGLHAADALFGTHLASEGTFFPTTGDINRTVTNPLGLTNRPDLTPSGPVEKIGSGVLEGLAGGVGGAALGRVVGGPLGAVRAVPAGLSGAVGGGATAASQEAFPDANPLVHLGVGLAASLATGKPLSNLDQAMEGAENQATLGTAQTRLDALNAEAQRANEMKFQGSQDATRQGFYNRNAAEANRDAQLAEADRDHLVREAGVNQQLMQLRGAPAAAEEVGGEAQDIARQWLDNSSNLRRGVYGPVEQNIPDETPVDLSQLQGTLRSLVSRGSSDEVNAFSQAIAPTDAPRLQNILSQIVGDNAEAPVSWNDARVIRDSIGDALGDPRIKTNMSRQALSSMYAATQDSMRSAANDLPALPDGTKLGDLYQQASQQAEAQHGFAQNVLSKIISSPNETKEGMSAAAVPGKLLKMDGDDVAALRANLGDAAVDRLTQVALTPQQGVTVPTWDRLKPSVQEALVPDPQRRSQINQLLEDQKNLPSLLTDRQAQVKTQYANELRTAQEADMEKGLNLSASDRAARQAAQAQAAEVARLKAIPSPMDAAKAAGAHGIGGLLGNHFGHDLAATFGHSLFPNMSDYQLGAAGGLLGSVAPSAFYNSLGMLNDPRALRLLGVGGVGAAGQAALGGQRAGP